VASIILEAVGVGRTRRRGQVVAIHPVVQRVVVGLDAVLDVMDVEAAGGDVVAADAPKAGV
jgi:hypothetical protein